MGIVEFIGKGEATGKIMQGQFADFVVVQPIVLQSRYIVALGLLLTVQ